MRAVVKPSHLCNLPPELWWDIAEDLGSISLINMGVTCKLFHNLTEFILARRCGVLQINLGKSSKQERRIEVRTKRFQRLLAKSISGCKLEDLDFVPLFTTCADHDTTSSPALFDQTTGAFMLNSMKAVQEFSLFVSHHRRLATFIRKAEIQGGLPSMGASFSSSDEAWAMLSKALFLVMPHENCISRCFASCATAGPRLFHSLL